MISNQEWAAADRPRKRLPELAGSSLDLVERPLLPMVTGEAGLCSASDLGKSQGYHLVPPTHPHRPHSGQCQRTSLNTGLHRASGLSWASQAALCDRDSSRISCLLQGSQENAGSHLSHPRHRLWASLNSSVGKESACNAGDPALIHGSGRSTREGLGYPPQRIPWTV